jgi:DNA helicase HerA-like ATPase
MTIQEQHASSREPCYAGPHLPRQKGESELYLLPMANRHGLITGAPAPAETVTLQGLAEGFSKNRRAGLHGRREGDLSGISQPERNHRPSPTASRIWIYPILTLPVAR